MEEEGGEDVVMAEEEEVNEVLLLNHLVEGPVVIEEEEEEMIIPEVEIPAKDPHVIPLLKNREGRVEVDVDETVKMEEAVVIVCRCVLVRVKGVGRRR